MTFSCTTGSSCSSTRHCAESGGPMRSFTRSLSSAPERLKSVFVLDSLMAAPWVAKSASKYFPSSATRY